MQVRDLIKVVSVLGVASAAASYLRFRREMKEACARLEAGSTVIETCDGPVEKHSLTLPKLALWAPPSPDVGEG